MAYASMENAIILKGTRHGLLASVREDADWNDVLRELAGVASQNAEFLKDAQLVLDFGWREVTEEQFDSIVAVIKSQGLGCNGILSTSLNTRTIAESRGYRAIIGRLGLAQHQGRRLRRDQEAAAQIAVPAAQALQTPIPTEPSSIPIQHAAPPVSVKAAAAAASELTISSISEALVINPQGAHAPSPTPVPAAPPLSIPGPVSQPAEMPDDFQPSVVPASDEVPVPAAPPAPAMRVEDSLEVGPSSEDSIEDGPTSTFDSADPIIANLPMAFDSSEMEGPRAFSSSHEPGIHVPHYQDEEPTLYIRKTLRSGQRVVFAGNVVLLGDLNPGAQIEADGDVIVLGQLRGSVHAGCEGDEAATVVTSSLRATQLRIADRFYKADPGSRFFRKTPPSGTLRARLDGDTVVVEALPAR